MPNIDVYCGRCGSPLCNGSDWRNGRGAVLDVEPCQKCLENERDEGYKDGYSEGQKDAQ